MEPGTAQDDVESTAEAMTFLMASIMGYGRDTWDEPRKPGIKDLVPLLRGSGALSAAQHTQLGRLAAAFGRNAREQLREIVELLRSGLQLDDNVYKNPFVVMRYRKLALAEKLFGASMDTAICLSVGECKRLLAEWRDGSGFGTVLGRIAAAFPT
jgi:hypothetical protein